MSKGLRFIGITGFALALGVIMNVSNANAAGAACVNNVYSRGSTGQCVRYIQTLNNAKYRYGISNYLSVDGSFGNATYTSIRKVQSAYSLKSDGIVGPKTWEKLCLPSGDAYYRVQYYVSTPPYGGPTSINSVVILVVPSWWPLEVAKSAGCQDMWASKGIGWAEY